MNNDYMAKRVTSLKASAIREIFKMLGDPEIISFAGGNPSPDTFPGEALGAISRELLEEKSSSVLQYGVTEGYLPLRNAVREWMKSYGNIHECDDLIITAGGQQAIDLTAKTLINEGDTVIVEAPSFIGGLNSFRSYNANLVGIEMENDGMNLDKLEAILKEQKVKLVYTIATFQNPTGITMSIEKRQRLLSMAEKYDFYILEDNPYGELRYSGENVPSIKSMDENGRVIYAGSFSKILSPGLRVGWVIAKEPILDRIIVCKQVSDVHTAVLNQMMAYEFMQRFSMDEHIASIRALYGRKAKLMMDSIDEHFPDFCKRTSPEGGIFLWCSLPERFNTKELMQECMAKKVAFVPGATCMTDIDAPCSMFRLNYSTPSDEQIVRGIKIIGDILKTK